MADAFSYFLPDGTPVNAGDTPPPPGTPYYKSAALRPDDNGLLTSTAQGDAANAFRGFVSADGGSFGGYTGPKTRSVMDELMDPNGEITAPDDPYMTDKMQRGLMRNGITNSDGSFTRKTLEAQRAAGQPDIDILLAQLDAKEKGAAGTPTATDRATATPNKVTSVPNDPFAAFGQDTLPQEQAILSPRIGQTPTGNEEAALKPRIGTTPAGPTSEGYRRYTGRPFEGPGSDGAAPALPQAAWSGGNLAPSAGSASRPSMTAGRFGRFSPLAGGQMAQKMRQRFKPLGAPANGFTPQAGVAAPSTQVF